jgi:hypothetical protein
VDLVHFGGLKRRCNGRKSRFGVFVILAPLRAVFANCYGAVCQYKLARVILLFRCTVAFNNFRNREVEVCKVNYFPHTNYANFAPNRALASHTSMSIC